MGKYQRIIGTEVQWCEDPHCKLFGIDMSSEGEDNCRKCDKPLTNLTHAVVATDKHYVLMGLVRVKDIESEPRVLRMWDSRMAVYWSEDMKGLFGLAEDGPSASCRISGSVIDATIYDVHGIFRCTELAVVKWEEQPWG